MTHERYGIKHRGEASRCVICNWKAAKSICTCGHSGDGELSDHNGLNGHGSCRECVPCVKFSWSAWTHDFATELKDVIINE